MILPPDRLCVCGCRGDQHRVVWKGSTFKGTRCEAHGGHKFQMAPPELPRCSCGDYQPDLKCPIHRIEAPA